MSFSRKALAGVVVMVVVCACVFALAGCSGGQQGSSSSNSDSTTKTVSATGSTFTPISITLFNNDIQFELASTNGWEQDGKTYIQFNVNVENQGDNVDSWELSIPFNGDLSVSDSWDCVTSVDGSTLTISNESYNGSIDADQSVKGVGFIVCGESNLAIFM